ncbi:MAG: hypothetical protein HFF18_00520 [Oscillospiraceae bacterium]|nr:hypothetical protein [Oscillospiraceae bacterium]
MKWKLLIPVCLLCCGLVLADVVWLRLNDFCPFNLTVHWGFLWPVQANCSEVYHQSCAPSFNGDGAYYHVFSYQNENVVASMLDWVDPAEDVYISTPVLVHANQHLNSISVPEDQRPNWRACLYWTRTRTDLHKLTVLWDRTAGLLYFVELHI